MHAIRINKKEAINLKKSEKEYMEGLDGGKKREKCGNYKDTSQCGSMFTWRCFPVTYLKALPLVLPVSLAKRCRYCFLHVG